MEEEKGNVLAYAMKGGLYLGGVFVLRDVAGMLVYSNVVSIGGAYALSFLSIISFLLTVCIVVKCTNVYKAELLKEDVGYLKVWYYCFYLFFFASMLYAVFTFLSVTILFPEALSAQKVFFDSIFAQMVAQRGVSVQLLSPFKEAFDKGFSDLVSLSPREMAMNSLFGEMSYGFFFSLVASIFLCKKSNSSLPGGGDGRI